MIASELNLASLISDFNPLVSTILEKIPEAILLVNADGQVIYANGRLNDLLGYQPGEVIGLAHEQAVTRLLGKNNQYSEIKAEWYGITQGENLISRRKFTHKNGHTVSLEARAYPLIDDKNNFCGEAVFLKDLHKELLVKVTELVNSSLSLQEVLDNTVEAVVDHIGLASNTIFLLNEDKTHLHLVTCTVFPNQEEVQKVLFELGKGIPGKVAATKQIMYVENLCKCPDVSEQARKYHGNESCLTYPLICKEEVLGVISFNADTIRAFTEKEQSMFDNIANQVALAVYNAQLFSQLQHLSTTDGLTGLYNHRYFQERLRKEIKRIERNDGFLSLLMLDVDNFKNYNDTFGHVYGDEILKTLAELIKLSVRTIDIVARYGGEEFAVILVDCPKEEAHRIAQRIKDNIENYEFFGREKQPGGKVTVSIGLALYKEPNPRKLMDDADQALYKAKKTGKNKVELAVH